MTWCPTPQPTACYSLLLACFGLLANAAVAETPPDVVELRIEPAQIDLRGDNRRQQLLVTARLADGREIDAGHLAKFEVGDPALALIDQGVAIGVADGQTELHVQVGSQSASLPMRMAGLASYPPVHFVNDVLPVFSKLGCNSGGCHGRAAGQNGFKLSVFGYDPVADHDALTKEARGRRVFPSSPERSLLVLKPTGLVPHGGGVRMAEGSLDSELLVQWIQQGMPWGQSDAPVLQRLEVSPRQRVLRPNDSQRILATAIFSDGRRRDVTAAASYASNARHVAEVERDGEIRSSGLPGEAAVTVSYMGQVAAVRVLIPRPNSGPLADDVPTRTKIDELVAARLRLVGVPPSGPADDATFLRRLHVDAIGRLPTADELREFLADPRDDRRDHWIQRVLARDEFADFWAMKWSDILLVDRQKLGDRGAYELHRWLRQQLAVNRPYDEWVHELVAATGHSAKSGPANFYRSVDNAEGLTRVLSQAFLGVRLECAQCHHHPFEKWSQDDFYGLSGFFLGVERLPLGKNAVLVYHSGLKETRIPLTNRVVPTRVLDGPAVTSVTGDPRAMLADWMTSPSNPWFARLAVNRLWKQFLGRGLVESEDDLRSTNPPTNEPLLDYLAQRLVEERFDLRAIMREILASATYQRSSEPNEANADDDQSASHYLAKRLPAEVLLDAISDVTGVPESFPGQPPGTRATQLWDNRLPSYFLEIFGRPERTSPCECGRSSEPTMAQALHLMNSPEIEARLRDENGRVARLAASSLSAERITEELCLVAVSRMPNEAERQIAAELFASSPRRDAAADFLWTLLNSRDFLFNH